MSWLVSKKILLILAIWFLSGGLAFADSVDLTDEFQSSLLDRTQALENDLDEVRDTVEDGLVPVAYLYPIANPGCYPQLAPIFDIPSQAARRSLHEILRTFRI